jgi:hypothetical protein
MTEEPKRSQEFLSRARCRFLVEAAWREMLLLVGQGEGNRAALCLAKLDAKTAKIMMNLTSDERTIFLDNIDQERSSILNEFNTEPASLRSRLEISKRGQFPYRD